MSLAPPQATTTPAAPPSKASSTHSTSARCTSRPREAPSAVRTAICWRWVTERESMRLARFAQAMSRTKLAIHISRCRSSLYCCCMRCTPAPPGARRRYCLGMRAPLGAEDVGQWALEELPQLDLHLRLDGRRLCAGRDAPDEIEPLLVSALEKVSIDGRERRHQVDGKPKGGRRGAEALAVEAGRRNAYNGDRLAVDGEAGADDGRIASQFLLPGLEADDGDGRRALGIVGGLQQPSSVGQKAEGGKGISGDEFAVPGLCGLIAAGAAHGHLDDRRIRRQRGWRSRGCGRETAGTAGRRIATSHPLARRNREGLPFLQHCSLSPTRSRVDGSCTGNDRRSTACTRVKMAVVAPMPSARVRTAVRAKPGDRRNCRNACFRSANTGCFLLPPFFRRMHSARQKDAGLTL